VTRYARHFAREIATLRRLREKRKSSPRGTSSPLEPPSNRRRPPPAGLGTCRPSRSGFADLVSPGQTVPVVANAVSAAEAASVEADAAVQEEVLVLKAARARETAIRLADGGDHAHAQSLLHAAAADLDALPSELARAQAEELRAAEMRIAPALYDASSRKQIWFDKHRAQRRRER
jgi:hypothetical protein